MWLLNFNIILNTCFKNLFRRTVKNCWFHSFKSATRTLQATLSIHSSHSQHYLMSSWWTKNIFPSYCLFLLFLRLRRFLYVMHSSSKPFNFYPRKTDHGRQWLFLQIAALTFAISSSFSLIFTRWSFKSWF